MTHYSIVPRDHHLMELFTRVRQVLRYEPTTGKLLWRVPKSNWVREGDEAGYIHHSGYRLVKLDRQVYRARQLIWLMLYGTMPKRIYSKNRIRSDNRVENLFT